VYDVKALLHPGPNTVAVAIANYGAAAGVNKGVELRMHDPPAAPAWSRSTFNGLAQVIVQTTKRAGAIQLGARAAGLAPATLPLTANSASVRPSVE
jgi:beta-galactosidase